MGVLIAGESGSVLVAASRASTPPAALALEGLSGTVDTPWNVRAYPLEAMPDPDGIDSVQLVAGEESTRRTVEQWADRHGLPVMELRLDEAEAPDGVPVVAVYSPSTGSGKSMLARKLARSLSRSGGKVAVVRHPIASLLHWPERHAPLVIRTPAELAGPRPLDETEELAPNVESGVPVITGLDAGAALRAASEAKVIVWEGGGSALPWVRPTLRVVVIDLVRLLPESAQAHAAHADVIVMTKGESASEDRARQTEATLRAWNPDAQMLLVDMPIAVTDGRALVSRQAVIVEDWPSLQLGGLKAGAGSIVARRFRCGAVDPRPFAVGAVATALEAYPHIGAVIPSLGRTHAEQDDLRETILATPGEVVLWASPASPDELLGGRERRPVIRAFPEVIEMAGGSLQEVIRPFLPGQQGLEIRRRR